MPSNSVESVANIVKGPGTVKVVGGGAWAASDKIIQLNEVVDLDVSYFYAEDYGKVIRSCGNCEPNPSPRNIVVSNSAFNGDGPICGINTNLVSKRRPETRVLHLANVNSRETPAPSPIPASRRARAAISTKVGLEISHSRAIN